MKKLLVLAALVAIAAPGFAAGTDNETVNLTATVSNYVDLEMADSASVTIDPATPGSTLSFAGTVVTNDLLGVTVTVPVSTNLTAQGAPDLSVSYLLGNGATSQTFGYNSGSPSDVSVTGTPSYNTATPAATYTGSVTLTATAI